VSPEPALRSLAPGAVSLWRIAGLGRAALFTAGAAGVEVLADLPLPTGLLTAALAVIALALALAVPPLRYRAWGFDLRDDHVYLQHGVLFRTTSIVPHARIQHVDTRHGPIDRWLGLASLVVFTAGTRGAIVTIPALDQHEAETLRDRLAALSGAGDAV
jgi:membrane protein YdbS with pleckstrin-like domain